MSERFFKNLAIWAGRWAQRLGEITLFEALSHPATRSHMEDRRTERYWPSPDLSIEQIEGMFEYGMSMDYSTPFGILHIAPDGGHVPKNQEGGQLFEDRRKVTE